MREEPPGSIEANIVNIDTRRYGERVFTLDNGQVWVEKAPNRGLVLKEEDKVTIKAGLFGSYKLFGSGNRFSKVERMQ